MHGQALQSPLEQVVELARFRHQWASFTLLDQNLCACHNILSLCFFEDADLSYHLLYFAKRGLEHTSCTWECGWEHTRVALKNAVCLEGGRW